MHHGNVDDASDFRRSFKRADHRAKDARGFAVGGVLANIASRAHATGGFTGMPGYMSAREIIRSTQR